MTRLEKHLRSSAQRRYEQDLANLKKKNKQDIQILVYGGITFLVGWLSISYAITQMVA